MRFQVSVDGNGSRRSNILDSWDEAMDWADRTIRAEVRADLDLSPWRDLAAAKAAELVRYTMRSPDVEMLAEQPAGIRFQVGGRAVTVSPVLLPRDVLAQGGAL